MTDKERAIDLLQKIDWMTPTVFNESINVVLDYGKLADELLAGGAIFPPCKVGDTVYVNIQYMLPDGSYRTEGPVVGQVCSIYLDKDGNEIEIEGDDPYFENTSICRSFADFGNNVFITRAKAEQALKKRNKIPNL